MSATLMLTLGMSIKAGAILMAPALFGWIQYQYGTIKLVHAVLMLVVL
jgi:hypothetical protein